MSNLVYLSLGSNVGDRAVNLHSAIDHLRAFGEVVAVSSFYETEPVEFTAQAWFLNCVVALDTEKTPRQLLDAHSRNRATDGTPANAEKRTSHH